MKKSYIFATLAVAAMGFTSCEADKEPVYSAPTEFVLNIPPMSDQTVYLQAGDAVNFTCTQPNYGVSLVTNYAIDVTLDEEFIEETEDQKANYVTLNPMVANQANFDISAEALSTALLGFIGIDSYASYPEEGVETFADVRFRAHAWLTGIEGSSIYSNTVTLAGVDVINPFPAEPRLVYLVGNPNGWLAPDKGNKDALAEWALEETGVGTDVYVGSMEIPAGEQYFRFYKELKGWGSDNALPSIGPKGVDGENEACDIVASDDPVKHKAVPGKGSWFTPATWEGGAVTFTLDLSKEGEWWITMVPGAVVKETYVYCVGSFPGCSWVEPSEGNASAYEDFRLVDRGGTGIYTQTFTLPQMELYFRVYPALTGWGATPYSAGNVGNDTNVPLTFGTPAPYSLGEDCWIASIPADGDYTITLDTKAGNITVAPAAAE